MSGSSPNRFGSRNQARFTEQLRQANSPQRVKPARLELVEERPEPVKKSPQASPIRPSNHPKPIEKQHDKSVDEIKPSRFYNIKSPPSPVARPEPNFHTGDQCVIRATGAVVTYMTSNDSGYHTVVSPAGVISWHLLSELKAV